MSHPRHCVCKGTGVCQGCHGRGCSTCSVKDVLSGVWNGKRNKQKGTCQAG